MKCEAKTTKKAWKNPLAPRSRCSKDATVEVPIEGRVRKLCTGHAQVANENVNRLSLVKHCCGSLFYSCGCKESA